MSVDDAFGNYQPANGDIVKSQFEFAMYDEGLGWIGNLTYMVPGKGYMFKTSNQNGILSYPMAGLYKSTLKGNGYNPVKGTPWVLNEANYRYNMSIVANLISNADISENNAIGAFVKDECRGIAKASITDNQTRYFMSVYADKNEPVEFKLIDLDNNKIYRINEQTNFVANSVVGDFQNPFNLTIDKQITTLHSDVNMLNLSVSVFPNPFVNDLMISYNLPQTTLVKVELFNILGIKICDIVNEKQQKGAYKLNWHPADNNRLKLKPGIYILKISTGKDVKTLNIIKK
jgi:hypothetical protein